MKILGMSILMQKILSLRILRRTLSLRLALDSWIGKQVPALEQVRDVIRALQTFTAELFAEINSNVNIRAFTILEKWFILDA